MSTDARYPQPNLPVADYSHVWWVIDPRDRYGCCPDCQRLAAASPYTAPGSSGGNELPQTPGDGGTACGGACTCAQAYAPPHELHWQPLAALTPDERKMRIYPKTLIIHAMSEADGLGSLPDVPAEPASIPAPYPSPGPQYQQSATQPLPPAYPVPHQPPYYPAYPAIYPSVVSPPQIVYYQNQSFTGKAVVAFLLYWVGYLPGLIFNIMFINEAGHVKDETGRTPDGYGCLWATLIGSLLPALLFAGLCIFIWMGVLIGGSATH